MFLVDSESLVVTQYLLNYWVLSPLLLHVRVVELLLHAQVSLLPPEVVQAVNALPVLRVVLHPHPAAHHQARHVPQVVHPEVLGCPEKVLQVVAAHQIEEAASPLVDHFDGVAAGNFGHLGDLVVVAPEDFKQDPERTRIEGADVDVSGASSLHILLPNDFHFFSKEGKGLELRQGFHIETVDHVFWASFVELQSDIQAFTLSFPVELEFIWFLLNSSGLERSFCFGSFLLN